ncbi:MAG TPA: amidohydrolase family protein [Acidimicrobiia bacterium]|nr:amidohydrolase family protein [Acidimicrobiia bacterium]
MTLDLVVRGGIVVDGTGREARRADVGVRDGMIVEIGAVAADAPRAIDADGLVVAPGFIDIHTHYDAQVLWDPGVSPSPLHGVTTVIGGNCGFSIAPLGAAHVDYIQQMMARVEGMSLASLRGGPAWDWVSFGDYLDRVEGKLAVNAGFLAGHSTIRRVVMGDDATARRATAAEIATMVQLLDESLAAGALGFSSSLGDAHTDGAGKPVPSRAAARDEFLALAGALRSHPGTMLEFIPAVGEISAERMDLMADMSLAANRPLNWNLLGSLSPVEIYEQQLEASDIAAARGAEVLALTLPDLMRLRASTLLESLPGWKPIVRMPDDERRAALRDPATRTRLRSAVADAAANGLAAMAHFDLVEIAEGPFAGRSVDSVAQELDVEPADVLVDVVLPDRLALTLILPSLVPSLGASQAGWEARAELWRDPRVLLGGSDAGAHIDLMCHGNYPSVVLGHAVRERKVLEVEEAVHLMTDRPARVLGLRGRGRIEVGWHADLAIFDPAEIASQPVEVRRDLPAGGERLHAGARGMEHVIVGGRTVVEAGAATGELAGTLLRSGRDTETVTVAGGSARSAREPRRSPVPKRESTRQDDPGGGA